MDKAKLGSKTAKDGFANEKNIIKKFNEYKTDPDAKKWLEAMGYDVNTISKLEAIQVPTTINKTELDKYNINEDDYKNFIKYKKADAQIKISMEINGVLKIENISIKKANDNSNYNQIDKRKVDTYQKMWGFDDEIKLFLKLFTGEEKPLNHKTTIDVSKLKKKDKRIFLNELSAEKQSEIIDFFEKNKFLIISDILKGRGGLSAGWIMVTKHSSNTNEVKWIIADINIAMNYWGNGKVALTPRGSLSIGRIVMQRKGGTPDPESLQFKFHPCDIFDIEEN